MSKPNYAYKNMTEQSAKAYGRNLPISTKTSIEICSHLRGMTFDRAVTVLTNVLQLKQAIPFTRFMDGVGHRKGNMAAGRYPQKGSQLIKDLLMSAKSNAENKGLSDSLVVAHICAHKAATPFHNGRQKRRVMKRTHIEIVLEEVVPESKSQVETQSSKATGAQKQKASSEKEKIVSKTKTTTPKITEEVVEAQKVEETKEPVGVEK